MFPPWIRALLRDHRVAFVVVGGINTVIGFLLYVAFVDLASFPYLVALPTSYVAASFIAFWLHRHFVFRVRGHVLRDLFRFILVNIGALVVNEILLTLAVEVVGLNPIIGQLAATAVTVVLSFLGHRDFSFRRPRQLKGQAG